MTFNRIPIVINAGGNGTRLYPYTKILPKALIPINDTPIAEIIMDSFEQQGFRSFYLIVNCKKDLIKAYFNSTAKAQQIQFCDEDEPLGTGGGIKLLEKKIGTTFVFTYCDILLDIDYSDLIQSHCQSNSIVTMVCAKKRFTIPYGSIKVDEEGTVIGMEEKPDSTLLVNAGVYIVEPKIFQFISPNEKITMPDILSRCMNAGEKVGTCTINENLWWDMGIPEELDRFCNERGAKH